MGHSLAEVLNGNLASHGWSFKRLAKEAGLPPNTVYRWTQGEVDRVRHWQDLAKVAHALDLTRSQADALLASGGHPSTDVLLARVTDDDDRDLLARWTRTTPHNLPAKLTSFIGREHELEQITRLLGSARLVTLTGPGGSGKTRLAIEAAQAMLDAFEEVVFVDLAAVRDPDLFIPTISRALGLTESMGNPPLKTLVEALRGKNVLLVLDNVEQVVAAAPRLTELLWTGPGLKAMVTSRTRLDVRGEHELAVHPLALPSPASSFDELTRNAAVALFADRARTVDPSFTLNPDNALLVTEVCARLEGLPLGIELAAAKTRHVRLSSMAGQSNGRLALATGGPRDAPDRQQTLRAAIAWSHDLLGDAERTLFRSTGVFAGGFSEQAIASVSAAIEQTSIDVPAGLESLVEQNLLRRHWGADDEPRYEMLETIREYALEKLADCGKVEMASSAATRYFLSLAERADLEGEGQTRWLPRLIAEQDNFQVALGWCKQRGQVETGLRLCIALMPLWQVRDYQLEARTWLGTFMTIDGAVPPELRARGLLWQGLLLLRGIGDDATASPLFEEALALFRTCGDLNGASEALQAEADVYRNRGEWQLASQRYTESLELGLRSSNAYLVSHAHMGLALCAQEVESFDVAQHHWELTLEWAEKAANRATTALALNSLGEMARHRGDWNEAERYYDQTLILARELGSEFRMALALHNLGYVALNGGDSTKAARLFTDSLSLYDGRQYDKGVAECLAGLAMVEVSNGRLERAARLCGATEAILEALGTRLDTVDRANYERTRETLRHHLRERLETLLEEGREMPTKSAVTYAVADLSTAHEPG